MGFICVRGTKVRLFVKVVQFLLLVLMFFVLVTPFAVADQRLGVIIIGMLILAYSYRRQRRLQDWRHPLSQGAALLAIVLVLLSQPMYRFFEAGFNDGPFVGKSYVGELPASVADQELPYRAGKLQLFNRSDDESPILVYVKDSGERVWAWEMNVALSSGYEATKLYAIERLEIQTGFLRDQLVFLSYWSYGAEQGVAYVWKLGGPQRFYLSW